MPKCVIEAGRCITFQNKRHYEGDIVDLEDADATRLIQKGTVALYRPPAPSATPEAPEPATDAPEPQDAAQDEPQAPVKKKGRKKKQAASHLFKNGEG